MAGIAEPVTWISTSLIKNKSESLVRKSFANFLEVQIVEDLLLRLEFVLAQKSEKRTVAILTGYTSQKTELERRVRGMAHKISHLNIECNTVDAFQGREADIAIYSVTRSNERGTLGFLSEKRRLNVALSRGKEKLVIVGDHSFCRAVKGPNPYEVILRHIESSEGCELKMGEQKT